VSQPRPAPPPPPALIAEATKRAGLIWITIEGQDRSCPAWHVWRAGTGPGAPGAAYVVTGPGEQPLPGLADAGRVTVIVAGSQASGGRVAWTAAVTRVEPGSAEWDEVIGPLVAGRLNAVLAEGETRCLPAQDRLTQRHRTLAPCYPPRRLPFTHGDVWPAIVSVAITTSVAQEAAE
jgi:hypothetical protein